MMAEQIQLLVSSLSLTDTAQYMWYYQWNINCINLGRLQKADTCSYQGLQICLVKLRQ